jgi:hypothetical protein
VFKYDEKIKKYLLYEKFKEQFEDKNKIKNITFDPKSDLMLMDVQLMSTKVDSD